ncbi:MAG: ribulose-phosphate 3-epimerase [Phycisphaeraceae bacterium]|nr:ribulose-phosphate 3-epimerase [Phycisphaeraceae bacterium]
MLDITNQPKRPLVAASILSADFGRMAEECRDVLGRGADLLHVDVMDGHFVPNLTMGQDMIRGLRRNLPDVFLDVHLMVERPQEYVKSFAEAGANLFSFHLEVCRPARPDGVDARELIRAIRDAGMLPGMVVNPPTPADGLLPFLDDLALVLVMSVYPGRSGQSFIPDVLPKLELLRQHARPTMRLEIDGGVNLQTVSRAVAAGADTLVTASALFGARDRKAVVDAMHNA